MDPESDLIGIIQAPRGTHNGYCITLNKQLLKFDYITENVFFNQDVEEAYNRHAAELKRTQKQCKCQQQRLQTTVRDTLVLGKCFNTTCPNRRAGVECPVTCGESCMNRPFASNLIENDMFSLHYDVARSRDALVALKPHLLNSVVAEAHGYVMFSEDAPSFTTTEMILPIPGTTLVMDLTRTRNLCRYALRDADSPKCRLVSYVSDDGCLHLLLVAIKPINQGEYITWSLIEEKESMQGIFQDTLNDIYDLLQKKLGANAALFPFHEHFSTGTTGTRPCAGVDQDTQVSPGLSNNIPLSVFNEGQFDASLRFSPPANVDFPHLPIKDEMDSELSDADSDKTVNYRKFKKQQKGQFQSTPSGIPGSPCPGGAPVKPVPKPRWNPSVRISKDDKNNAEASLLTPTTIASTLKKTIRSPHLTPRQQQGTPNFTKRTRAPSRKVPKARVTSQRNARKDESPPPPGPSTRSGKAATRTTTRSKSKKRQREESSFDGSGSPSQESPQVRSSTRLPRAQKPLKRIKLRDLSPLSILERVRQAITDNYRVSDENLGRDFPVIRNNNGAAVGFECDYPGCGYTNRIISAVRYHYDKKHSGYIPCPFCTSRLASKAAMDNHLRSHIPKQFHTHKCPYCEYRTDTAGKLKLHRCKAKRRIEQQQQEEDEDTGNEEDSDEQEDQD